MNDYCTEIAIHPGKTLEEILETIGMTQANLAQRTGLTPKTINEIIQGKSSITADTAIKLSAVFGMSAAFWNNLETRYQEALAKIRKNEELHIELEALKKFSCYKELSKWGYVKDTLSKSERIDNLLNFFGVSSLKYVYSINEIAFRKSKDNAVDQVSLVAWLRCGEIQAQNIDAEIFDKSKLIGNLPYLRRLTREQPDVMQRELVRICSSFGVAVVFTPYFKNTYVNGATRWITPDKAIIQFSLRGHYSDIFWFTFFHELGHILKHSKKDQFIEFEKKKEEDIEQEADDFASNILIPKNEIDSFKKQGKYSDIAIHRFAHHMGVSVGIVAGRLSHEYNNWKRFAHLRDRIKFLQRAKGKQ